jgi:hypothetical protein
VFEPALEDDPVNSPFFLVSFDQAVKEVRNTNVNLNNGLVLDQATAALRAESLTERQ